MSRPSEGSSSRPERGRWSSRRKTEIVLRVLRGEDLDALSRELGVTAATIAGWRDQFLAGGQAAVRSRPSDERDEEIARLRAKVGEITMANELLLEWARKAEAAHSFGPRRSKPCARPARPPPEAWTQASLDRLRAHRAHPSGAGRLSLCGGGLPVRSGHVCAWLASTPAAH